MSVQSSALSSLVVSLVCQFVLDLLLMLEASRNQRGRDCIVVGVRVAYQPRNANRSLSLLNVCYVLF